MMFWNDLVDPAVSFLRYAVIAGLLGSISFGVVGTLVVTRRIVSLAGAIAHSVLGGIGMALYCREVLGWAWSSPSCGALIAALCSAVIIWIVSICAREREDAVIGVIWAVGMALGLLFMAMTPGYGDLQTYLFGNILLLNQADLWWMGVVDLLVLIPVIGFYPQLLAVCFDSDFACLRGIPIKLFQLGILLLIALAIVTMVNVVGILLVLALLSLPASIAGLYAKKWSSMMIAAVLLSMLFTSGGIAVSYCWDWPCGPTIVLLAGMVYLLALLERKWIHSR